MSVFVWVRENRYTHHEAYYSVEHFDLLQFICGTTYSHITWNNPLLLVSLICSEPVSYCHCYRVNMCRYVLINHK